MIRFTEWKYQQSSKEGIMIKNSFEHIFPGGIHPEKLASWLHMYYEKEQVVDILLSRIWNKRGALSYTRVSTYIIIIK